MHRSWECHIRDGSGWLAVEGFRDGVAEWYAVRFPDVFAVNHGVEYTRLGFKHLTTN